MEVCESSSRSTVASCLLTSDSQATSTSSPSTLLPSPPSSGPRGRTHSFCQSMSWSQQQKPLLHIHLMFVILITASIWTYCMSRSDLSHASFFRISPNTHLLSHLYHQNLYQVKSHVNPGAVSVLADVPSSSSSGLEATSVITGPTGSSQQPAPQYRSSFSWSSSPYPSGTPHSSRL